MKADVAKAKVSSNLFLPAYKTTNMYGLAPTEYKKILKGNITKSYKKATLCLEDAINLEAKQTAKGIKLDNKIECTAKNPAFTTVKDSKLIFEKVNKYLGDLLKLVSAFF